MLVARTFGVVCFSMQINVKRLQTAIALECLRYEVEIGVTREKSRRARGVREIRWYLDSASLLPHGRRKRESEAHCCNGGPCQLWTRCFLFRPATMVVISLDILVSAHCELNVRYLEVSKLITGVILIRGCVCCWRKAPSKHLRSISAGRSGNCSFSPMSIGIQMMSSKGWLFTVNFAALFTGNSMFLQCISNEGFQGTNDTQLFIQKSKTTKVVAYMLLPFVCLFVYRGTAH